MNNSEIGNNVIELIKSGKTDKAIECLLGNTTSNELKGDLISLLSRFNRNNEDFLKELKTQEEKNVAENKIVSSLIHCLDELSNDEKLISNNSIQKEKFELLVSGVKFRESVRNFNENGHEELKQSVAQLIENLIKELNELKKADSDTIKFEIDDSNKSKFEFYLIWKNPVNKKSRTLLLDFTDDNNCNISELNDFKIPSSRLNLITYNKEVRPHSLSFSNDYRQTSKYYYPILNENCEICWKNKKQILSTAEVINRFIEIFIMNYDKKLHPANQITYLPRQRGRTPRQSNGVRSVNYRW